jgi:signal recognition particle receptor subunit beta
MVLFNYSAKELTAKIVYYGPGLGGKTTCLEYIYKTLPAKVKGKMLSLATQTDRTLFFDFLPVELGKIYNWRVKIQLYTVPGQVFYDATRKIVLKGADGVVFVVDSQQDLKNVNLESWENFKENLKVNNLDFNTIPLVIQYNKRDLKNVMPIEELEKLINTRKVPYFETIATEGKGVIEALKTITKLVLQNLQKQYSKVFIEEKEKEAQQEELIEKKEIPEAEKPVKEKLITPPEQLSNAEEKMYAKPKHFEEDKQEMENFGIPPDEEIAELPLSDEDLSLDESQWQKIDISKNNESLEEEIAEPPTVVDTNSYNNIQEIEEIEEIEELEIIEEEEEIKDMPQTNIKQPDISILQPQSKLDDTLKTEAKLSDTWKSSKKPKKEDIVTQKFLESKIKEITTSLDIKTDNIIDISSIEELKKLNVPIEINFDKNKNILNITIKLAFKLKSNKK